MYVTPYLIDVEFTNIFSHFIGCLFILVILILLKFNYSFLINSLILLFVTYTNL